MGIGNIDNTNKYLNELKDGNISVLAPLYECTVNQVFSVCFSFFRNPTDTEAAVSDTYMRIIDKIGTYSGKNGMAWICKIAKNVCLNIIRKSERVTYVDFESEQVQNSLGLSTVMQSYDGIGSDIYEVAEKVLKPHELRIVVLHAVHDLKFKEIARIEGSFEATVRWQYSNALKKIRAEYERRCDDEQ